MIKFQADSEGEFVKWKCISLSHAQYIITLKKYSFNLSEKSSFFQHANGFPFDYHSNKKSLKTNRILRDLNTHYNHLFEEFSKAFLTGNYFIDHQINSSSDNRFGLTLIIRVNHKIESKIQSFIEELKKIDPHQYYYPAPDIHVTVMSIISCYDGFRLENISVADYIERIEKSLNGINAIEIDFRGVTASSSAILIKGFPIGDSLNGLRNNLRANFKNSALEESMDKRYTIFTAHITIVRFSQKINDTNKLLKILEENRQRDFGKLKAEHLELVYNDWYQREKYVKQVHRFNL